MSNEWLRVRGEVSISLNGKKVTTVSNTVTSAGKAHIADQLAAVPAQSKMTNMALGTSSPSTTALGSEVKRKAFTNVTASSNVVTYTAHWDIDDNFSGSITEAGLFNAAALGGTMLCSASFDAISKGVNDNLDITWTLTIT